MAAPRSTAVASGDRPNKRNTNPSVVRKVTQQLKMFSPDLKCCPREPSQIIWAIASKMKKMFAFEITSSRMLSVFGPIWPMRDKETLCASVIVNVSLSYKSLSRANSSKWCCMAGSTCLFRFFWIQSGVATFLFISASSACCCAILRNLYCLVTSSSFSISLLSTAISCSCPEEELPELPEILVALLECSDDDVDDEVEMLRRVMPFRRISIISSCADRDSAKIFAKTATKTLIKTWITKKTYTRKKISVITLVEGSDCIACHITLTSLSPLMT